MVLNATGILLNGLTTNEVITFLKPLLIFVVSMVLYALFVYKFYQFLARRDVFKIELQKYAKGFSGVMKNTFRVLLYILENLIIFPVLVFFWFAVLAIFLLLLSRQPVETILLISIALVSSVRITAYYKEELSRDLAKMIPFALLGVFLIDISYFSVDSVITTAQSLPGLWKQALVYLGFVIIVEFILRILSFIPFLKRSETEEEKRN